MSNIRVKSTLERIGRDLARVRKHVALYSGVDAKDAMAIDTQCSGIAEDAAFIAAAARHASGNRSGAKLVTHVRKALGYTRPDPTRRTTARRSPRRR